MIAPARNDDLPASSSPNRAQPTARPTERRNEGQLIISSSEGNLEFKGALCQVPILVRDM